MLYLLGVTAGVFAIPSLEATRPVRWVVVPGLLAVQVLALWWFGVRLREVSRPAWRLKWLFLVLLACYAFLPGDDARGEDDWHRVAIPFTAWAVTTNLGGIVHATLMCVQILTVILASAVVRLTGPGTDLVKGLRTLRFPTLFVHALDQTLDLLGGIRRHGEGQGGGAGGGGNRGKAPHADGRASPGFFSILRQLVRGDIGFFTREIRTNLDRARERVRGDGGARLDEHLAHDVAIITGVGLVMVSLKMLKILPGVPFAPGFKTLLLYPLYVVASQLTHTRWGGTTAGAVMGVIGFLQGDGRFGVLEVLKHLAPGLLIDLLMPVVKRLPQSVFVYCALGFLAAIARTATEFTVVLLLGARAELFLFPAARLVPNLIAGTLSGFVSVFVLRAFDNQPPDPPGRETTLNDSGQGTELVTSSPSADNAGEHTKEV